MESNQERCSRKRDIFHEAHRATLAETGIDVLRRTQEKTQPSLLANEGWRGAVLKIGS